MTQPSLTLWPHLQRIANMACSRFGLNLKELRPMTNMRKRTYGDCSKKGIVELRVHMLNHPNVALSRFIIVSTLAHELAHLKEWRHGKAHKALALDIMIYWKEEGVA